MQKDIPSPEAILAYVTATSELHFIDAKGPCSWEHNDTKASLAKDIAALANTKGGGALVIGKADANREGIRDGLTESEVQSFEVTKVAKWVNNHFRPAIELSCHPVHHEGRHYVVIKVEEFSLTPVMCTKSSQSEKNKPILEVGGIYIRTKDVESTKIQSADDFHDLVRRAAIKHRDEMQEAFAHVLRGQTASNAPTDEQQFDRLASRMRNDLVDSPQAPPSGWRFMMHPQFFEKKWPTFEDLGQVLNGINVDEVRFPRQFPSPVETDWGAKDGFSGRWGLAYEGLFLYAAGFEEDHVSWIPPVSSFSDTVPIDSVPPGQWLNAIHALWLVRRFFLLASKFARFLDADETIRLVVSADNLKNRWLIFRDEWLDEQSLKGIPAEVSTFTFPLTIHAGELESEWSDRSVDCMQSLIRRFPIHPHLSRADLLNLLGTYARIGL
jgi:hypothetical protein